MAGRGGRQGVGGAPRQYDRRAILERFRVEMAKGDRNMEQICSDPGMPCKESIYLWVAEDDELFNIFLRAQELWSWAQRDIIIQIADDQSRDIIENEIETSSGDTRIERRSDNTAVNRDRLRVLARQWAMAKMVPKFFGEKVTNEHTGPDGERMPAPVINLTIEKK